MTTFTKFFPPDLPSAQGHFPGDPIVPGAALLASVLHGAALRGMLTGDRLRIGSAKFLHIVRPGQSMEVRCTASDGGRVAVICTVGAVEVLKAVLQCDCTPTTR